MELREFIQLVDKVIEQFIDQVDPETADYVKTTSWAGEWREAIECLMATLIRDQIPVTPTQRTDLARLLERLKNPRTQLDSLNIVVPLDQPGPTDLVERIESTTGEDRVDPGQP